MLPQDQRPKVSIMGQSPSYEHLMVADYAANIAQGERRTGLVCPFCLGGGSTERSFSVISYPDGIFWRCWRASCDKKGKINLSTGVFLDGAAYRAPTAATPSPDWPTSHYYLTKISTEWADKLSTEYGIILDYAIAKGWNGNSLGELVIPLKTCDGAYVVGHEFRRMKGEPKSRYNIISKSEAGFVRNAFECKLERDRKTCLIVEDSISALKGSIVCRTYSLQGTNFTQRHVEELGDKWGCDNFLLALDKDATEKASGLVQRYQILLPQLRLCPLKRDLKYYHVAEIEELIEGYKK